MIFVKTPRGAKWCLCRLIIKIIGFRVLYRELGMSNSLRLSKFLVAFISVFVACFVAYSQAMQPITDEELSAITGQAFITVSTSSFQQNGIDYQFTKLNIGAIIETLFNADLLKIGEFTRTADDSRTGDGTVRITNEFGEEVLSGHKYDTNNNGVYDADIIIENFALGHIEYAGFSYEEALEAAKQTANNGGNASEQFFNDYTSKLSDSADLAKIVPFLLENPYLELAKVVSGDDQRFAGVRLGFENGLGYLSGDLISLTGNIRGLVRGQDVEACVELLFTCIPIAVSFTTPFELIDGSDALGNASARGDGSNRFEAANLKRASWLGPQNGTSVDVTLDDLFDFPLTVAVTGCDAKLLGISTNVNTCFASTGFESIFIGDTGVDRTKSAEEQLDESAAQGVFISLQNENVPWENTSGVGDPRVLTETGAFLNIPSFSSENGVTYPINVTFQEAELGLPRISTCVAQLKGC